MTKQFAATAACLSMGLAALGASVAHAQADTTGQTGNGMATMAATLNAQDQLFMLRAADGNKAEVMTSQLALKKSKDGGVKQVAQTLIDGHSRAETELEGLAALKGVTPPKMLGPTHTVISQQLMGANGKAFDQMFVGAQVEDHENTIALFQQEIAMGQDPQVKAYAAKWLPDIEGHTAMIYQTASTVNPTVMAMRPPSPPSGPMTGMAGMGMSGGTSGTATAGMSGGAGNNGGAGANGNQ